MRIRLNNKLQLPCINFSFGKMTTNTGVISIIAHKIYPKKTGAFQFVAGWWRHQPGRRATAHNQFGRATN